MKLLTKELIRVIPALYGSELQPNADKIVYVKFFHPISCWSWYVLEYDGFDECFGLVVGQEIELGYFTISELAATQVYGLGIERDLYFRPTKLRDLPVAGIERFM